MPVQEETKGVLKILPEIVVRTIIAQEEVQKKDSPSNQHLIGPMIGLESPEACNTPKSTKQQQAMIGKTLKNDHGSTRQLLHLVMRRNPREGTHTCI